MRRTRALTFVLAASTVALLVVSASASAAGWERISRNGLSTADEATSALDGSSIVVAWAYPSASGTSSSEAVAFTSSLADSVQAPTLMPIVSGWSTLNSDPELISAPDGGLVLAFAGMRSTVAGDPLDGIAVAGLLDSGSWGAPVVVVPRVPGASGVAGLLLDDGSSLLSADCCGAAARVFHGAIDAGDAAGGGSVTGRAIARDGVGNVWMAWYDRDRGLVLRQLDGTTGTALGAPVVAPQSGSAGNAGSRVALACDPVAAGCRVVYRSLDGLRVLSWAPGEPAPTTIAPVSAASTLGVVHAAYRADGRLWVGWAVRPAVGEPAIRFTLGDARGAGGQSYPVRPPRLAPPDHLRLQPVGDDLLLIGSFGSTSVGSAQWADLVRIPAALPDTSGPADLVLRPGADGTGPRVQLQVAAPPSCGLSCTAHVELRDRTGTCSAACLASGGTSLPGDGRVVLGSRGTFALRGGRSVRVALGVSRASLRRTPFRTVGGFRVASTRLRIWFRTRSGTVLAVRDGWVEVPLAAVRSGPLAGLTGTF